MNELNPSLLGFILIPLLAGVFSLLQAPARSLCLTASGLNLVASLITFFLYDQERDGFQFIFEWPVLPELGLQLSLGADGFSLAMVFMSSLVTFAAVWVTPRIDRSPGLFYACLMFISAGAIGAFLSLDVFFFYMFHELALIPTFLLIGIWGSGDRQAAAWKMTIYLALGSFVLLLGILGMYFSMPEAVRSFDMRAIVNAADNGLLLSKDWVYLLLLFGFGILISLFPFHTWAPQGYASAPTPAAMLHAGVLKKFGLYGLIRIVVPVYQESIQTWMILLLVLLCGNILYVGLITIAQKRLDWMVGYSSVMHMGYVFLGIAAFTPLSLSGAAMVMFAHGLTVAAMFALAGEIRRRTGTLEFSELGGLAKQMPKMGLLFGFAAMASLGLPGFATFAGEIMVFFGAFHSARMDPMDPGFQPIQIATVVAIWGVVITAVYVLRAYRKIFFGEARRTYPEATDISLSSKLAVSLLIVTLLVVGFYPNILLRYIFPAIVWP